MQSKRKKLIKRIKGCCTFGIAFENSSTLKTILPKVAEAGLLCIGANHI
jgi:hypothetical protein